MPKLIGATYEYGTTEIDVAMDEEQNIYVATPTMEDLLGIRRDSARRILALKSFKALQPEGFAHGKIKEKAIGLNTIHTFYPFATFMALVAFRAIKKSDQKAINLLVTGFATDFITTAQIACGKKVNENERARTRNLIAKRLENFKGWTNIIRDRYIKIYGRKPTSAEYKAIIVKANNHLFGQPHFKCDRETNMTIDQKVTISEFESYLARTSRLLPDVTPEELLDMALKTFQPE